MAMNVSALVVLFGIIAIPVRASEFLKAIPHGERERLSEQDIRVSLLDEVEGVLGVGSASTRLSQLESILRPIAAALPKNEHGNLGHSAVRYALHRLFVLRHGWVIKGLNSDGGAYNSSSPAGVLKEQVPGYVQNLFEQRLAGKGFGLHDLAVLAATIEHLIHNEAVGRLGSAFSLHALPVTSPITEADANEVLDTYMMGYILAEDLNNMSLSDARDTVQEMPEIFLAWPHTQKFVRDVRTNVTKKEDALDFANLARVAETVGEEFGSFQDFECRELKDKLMNLEYRSTGRVKLSDFYKPALENSGAWTFQESASYLRQLGSLDETDPTQPSVIIANYLISQTNCIAASGFYSVCCKNECESLLAHLEENIGAPDATPASIVSLVENLPSSTVSRPHSLSASLLQHLDDIAASHEGKVPLHGRLFAQWMHHVYPRECPFPHISGTTGAKTPDEWLDESGDDATASEEEMMQYASAASNSTSSDVDGSAMAVEELTPWSFDEELLVEHSPPQLEDPWASARSQPAMRSLMLFAAASALATGLIQSMKAPLRLGGVVPEKYVI